MSLVADGSISFRGGQNDAVIGGQIPKDQYRRGINVTTNRGVLRPRPGFHHQKFVVVEDTPSPHSLSWQQILDTGKFQAMCSYDAENGKFLIVVFGGIIFRLDIDRLMAEVLPFEVSGDRMNQYRRRIPWSYAGRFLVFFDFPNSPVIVEPTMARRANRDEYEIPTSVLGAFNQNRLWIGNAGAEFGASDPVGGNANAPITFEESLAPAELYTGQFFSLGSSSHNKPLSYMGFLQVADSSTGVGPLLVATRDAVYAYRADLPRSEWENTIFGRLLLYNAGIAGPRSADNLNSDLLFLSGDNNARSLFYGSSEQQRWSNAPISKEVESWLEDYANTDLLDIAVCCAGHNRFFFTVAPHAVTARSLEDKEVFDYTHDGMVVLELANISQLGQQATPVWSGIWLGIRPMEIVNTARGTYVISKDSDNYNRIYLVADNFNASSSVDIVDGEEREITCRIYTREYDGDNRFSDKQLRQASYILNEVEGDLRFKVEYRPISVSDWTLWKDYSHCAETTTETAKKELKQKARHHFRELNFGDPEKEAYNRLTGDYVSLSRQTGLRITIKARFWQLEAIRLLFEDIEETNRVSVKTCEELPDSVELSKDLSDWAVYDILEGSPVWQ